MSEWEDNEPAHSFLRIDGATAVHKMEIEVIWICARIHVVHEVQEDVASGI